MVPIEAGMELDINIRIQKALQGIDPHAYVKFLKRKYGNTLLYNILLPIDCYIGNSTTICHSRSMSDNRELSETFHQNISSHYKVIASAF